MNLRAPTSLWFKTAMVGAVVAVFLLAYVDLRREQARALADFIGEQSALAQSFAETMSARIAGVVGDLEAAADVAESDLGASTLRRLVGDDGPRGDDRPYREADLLDPSGAPLAEVPAPEQPRLAGSPALQAARTTLLARLAPSQVAISGPLEREGQAAPERLRLFALRRGERVVVLLVDIDRLFAGMQANAVRATGAPLRWLVLDDAHRSVEFGLPGDARSTKWRTDQPPAEAEVAALLADMAAGKAGALFLGRQAADSLGLGQRAAVAGYAPVPVRKGPPWSVAVIASARRVRDRARLAAWRLGAATGLAGLLVALFGVAIGRQQRRELALAEALNLAEATSALRERSEKMVEVIPIGVLALDDARRVTSANPYLVGRGVLAGRPLAEALPTATADEVALLDALLKDARAQRRPIERMGLRLHLGGEEPRDVDAYAIPLGRPLTDVDCFLVLHDRTETRALERNLVRAEKLATIGTLAAGVAHEVGTPLGIISGRAEQLLARVPDGEAGEGMRKHVSSIMTQVDKVSTTIRQLLDFARIRPVDAEVVTPAQALHNAAALLEHRFRHAKVSLKVEAPTTVAKVAADPGQLEQVLVNLLMNACDACAAGGHVSARATEHGDRVAFEVVDDGAGIPAEHLSSVLDPFFTTKKRGQGTGLGLTIAADIVKNHGGSLEIDSTVGKGTTMRVLLPRSARASLPSAERGST